MKLLEAVLRLPSERLAALAARWHIGIDPKKRLTPAEQVARGLVLVPRLLDLSRLGDGAREAIRLLAANPEGLPRASLPKELEPLLEDGMLFPDPARPDRVSMPSAYRLQIPPSPSDSPRAARLLLQTLTEEARRELCQHHLGRVPPLPWPMLLETVLERLEDADWVRAEIASLGEAERGLLRAVDALGGEVSGEEVLELEREPVRIAQGGNVRVPRRSAIFSLARRGLVLTRVDGWVLCDEVERVVGRERRTRAGIERQRLLMSRHLHELTPARAHLAEPQAPQVVGLMAGLAALEELPSEGRGLSKGAVRRVAQQLHVDAQRAELLLCLARADGLFSASIALAGVPPRLWDAWRRGGAWDEAALEPDLFRPGHPATSRVTALLREALLDTLFLMPAGEFALASDVRAVTCSDRRALLAQRGLSAASRGGQEVRQSVFEVVDVLLQRSLPALGLVDAGEVEQGAVVRLSREARAWLELSPGQKRPADDPERGARWLDERRLFCGSSCDVSAVVEAARYAHQVWADDRGVGLEFSEDALARAADHDPDLAGFRTSIMALTEKISDTIEVFAQRACELRPMCTFVRASAFIEIEDAALREAIYRDPEATDLWAAPPLAEGLLVKPGASPSRVHSVLTRHGARLYAE